jgi:hypothetical protein
MSDKRRTEDQSQAEKPLNDRLWTMKLLIENDFDWISIGNWESF